MTLAVVASQASDPSLHVITITPSLLNRYISREAVGKYGWGEVANSGGGGGCEGKSVCQALKLGRLYLPDFQWSAD